ncbi:hypothetical protein [Xanthomonas arboricola]|uniref:hypothetical protein n=1 Tax=Xanthomonas arboricola TaxID=56448 RepID=UPI0011B0BB8A|nr:hypothetical protein [Xanthomonas arboricola]
MRDKFTERSSLSELNITGLLEIFAKTSAIAIPILYFVGWIYRDKFWLTLGLNELPGYTLESYVRWGFIVAFSAFLETVSEIPGGLPIALVILLALIVLIPTALEFLVFRRNGKRTRKWSERKAFYLRHWNDGIILEIFTFIERFKLTAVICVTAMYAIFLLLITVYIPIRISSNAGERDASKHLRELMNPRNGTYFGHQTLAYIKGKSSESEVAIVIDCSPLWCGVFKDGSFSAHSLSEIEKLESCGQTSLTKAGNIVCDWAPTISRLSDTPRD